MDRSLVTNGLIDMLRSVTRLAVGDHDTPPNWDGDYPYAVVYSLGGSPDPIGPPWSDQLGADERWTYQVTVVGSFRDQVEKAATLIKDAILGRAYGTWANPIEIDGAETMDRAMESTSGTLVIGSVFNVSDRYTLTTTPS